MDLTKFALVSLVVALVVEVFKRKLPPKVWESLDMYIIVLVGVGITFLVSYTTWAHSQVFEGVSLDNMRNADKVVAGLIVAAAGWGFSQVVQKAIPNIGQNQPQKPTLQDVRTVTQAAPKDNTPPQG